MFDYGGFECGFFCGKGSKEDEAALLGKLLFWLVKYSFSLLSIMC